MCALKFIKDSEQLKSSTNPLSHHNVHDPDTINRPEFKLTIKTEQQHIFVILVCENTYIALEVAATGYRWSVQTVVLGPSVGHMT